MADLPASKLGTQYRIGSANPITLSIPAENCLTHMVHHLSHIGVINPD